MLCDEGEKRSTQISWKHFTYIKQFIIKNTTQETPNGSDAYSKECLKVMGSGGELPCPLWGETTFPEY